MTESTRKTFTSPQQAEAAFYEAFARADAEAMARVWDDADDIVCIHPMGQRAAGAAVAASWRETFAAGEPVGFELSERRAYHYGDIAVHTLVENLHFRNDRRSPLRIVATATYRNGAGGWRMVLYHASPVPRQATEERGGAAVH